jgi:hypothetical protein
MTSPSPSSFATLLRHSKFASFDPAISQVYTAYGGDAHRGNWGLKRPLPIRRRRGFITANAVDSLHQQTEWSPAESQVRFIRRWDELNVDAEFAPFTSEAPVKHGYWSGDRTTAVPNIHSMSHREFTAYLEKLRKLRPAFKEYLQKILENHPQRRYKSLYELAQVRDTDYHRRFIASLTLQEFNKEDSQTVEPIPHRTGGLSYSHTTELESIFTTKTQPGIILQHTSDRRSIPRLQQSLVVSFAGLSASVRMRTAGGKIPIFDWRDGINTKRAADSFADMRVFSYPRLISVPNVVGQNNGLKGANIRMEVTAQADFLRSNPYIPGSRDYNDAEPPAEKEKTGHAAPMKFVSFPDPMVSYSSYRRGRSVLSKVLLKSLEKMTGKTVTR